MGYITENRLSNIIGIPVALPATQLIMGDWVEVATVKVQQPMRLTCRLLNFQIISSSVSVSSIGSGNYILGNLGLAYLVLRKNYTSGTPGSAGGLDSIVATDIGVYSRDFNSPVVVVDPGIYSWIVANNMQPSTNPNDPIPPTTSIDFVVAATGSATLELSYS